ncbi:DUF58 domain-containing protein [Aureitalea marina]|uniref:DUF58 domain-containing protein n=1 Tax=Aureitalea marina TaxID=930804 RepID=A0A2S7KSH6_9FLAO|nr:DUF58 domain-containing protein [Aureitalea marina]PQB05582.1 hypothetical protein BST85_12245 [Aureitalea marina]
MPKERLDIREQDRTDLGVYVTLRELIALQFEAHGFSFLPKFAVQSILSGRHRSKLRGRGLDFDQVRKYVAGDDIRNIDWRVTARVGVTHTKEFTEERERPVIFVIDQSQSMFFGSQAYFKSVVAAHLAAVGCWRVLEVGDRVGGIVFNEQRIDFVSPKRDRRTVQRLLSVIVDYNRELKAKAVDVKIEEPLNEALKRTAQMVSHDYLIVLISDLGNANAQTLKTLIRMRKNNDVIVGQITDPLESYLLKERYTISDGEFQSQVGSSKKLRREFHEEVSNRMDKLKTDFKKYGIPLIPFDTRREAAKQLRDIVSGKTR